MSNKCLSEYGRIGVLYGGASTEREISLRSGEAILNALKSLQVNAVGIELGSKAIIETIARHKIDTAFIALHGGIGEDGRLQSLLDFMGIRYTGSGVQASVVAMNKVLAKAIWTGMNISTPDYIALEANSNFQQVLDSLGGRAIVKPAHEGSSIGMSIVMQADDLLKAFELAREYDNTVIVERVIQGPEYTVGILGETVLPPIQLKTTHTFYDYQAKYHANDTQYLYPCGLSEEKEIKLKSLAKAAFDSLCCEGWGRVDVMEDADGNFYALEVNTVPGMTDHSLIPIAAKHAGYSFQDLVVEIVKYIKPKRASI